MDGKKIKAIQFILKSVHEVIIPIEFIGNFLFSNITIYTGSLGDNLCTAQVAEEFYIELDRRLNKNGLLNLIHDLGNIRSVVIMFADGSKSEYLVKQNESKRYFLEGLYQRSKFNRHGDLFIAISQNTRKIHNLFPQKEIDKADYEVAKNRES